MTEKHNTTNESHDTIEPTQTRIACIAIIVDNPSSVSTLNSILHEYAEFIMGRMGFPYRKKNINVISIIVDAPHDTVSALCGKIGRLDGINAKTVYSK